MRNEFHFLPDWQNPEVLSINRMGAHAPWGAYESAQQALSLTERLPTGRSAWTEPGNSAFWSARNRRWSPFTKMNST